MKYVGRPLTTSDGNLQLAFFAEIPGGGVVDGAMLTEAVEENSVEISAAVSSAHAYTPHLRVQPCLLLSSFLPHLSLKHVHFALLFV